MTYELANYSSLPIALTMGDVAGIGPEIIVKSFMDAPDLMQGTFVVGDVAHMRRATHLMAENYEPKKYLPILEIDHATQAILTPPHCIPVLQAVAVGDDCVPFGGVSARAGSMALQCVAWAAKAALDGIVSAIVTAPLCKESMSISNEALAVFPGHTELLQHIAASYMKVDLQDMPVRMMLANDELRVILVSVHVSLKEAISLVTEDRIFTTIAIAHEALSHQLGRAPKIAVSGLNPHAGENGLFGREEIEIITPACSRAQALGWHVAGPYAPDTVFMRARKLIDNELAFDAVIAMYHDQGLIPVKYDAIDRGVNITLGLPLLRVSPDHGTAFDIAGTASADAGSFIHSVQQVKNIIHKRGKKCYE
jgi:4-hydroxythreonine-4-phosphate dehydrogenase